MSMNCGQQSHPMQYAVGLQNASLLSGISSGRCTACPAHHLHCSCELFECHSRPLCSMSTGHETPAALSERTQHAPQIPARPQLERGARQEDADRHAAMVGACSCVLRSDGRWCRCKPHDPAWHSRRPGCTNIRQPSVDSLCPPYVAGDGNTDQKPLRGRRLPRRRRPANSFCCATRRAASQPTMQAGRCWCCGPGGHACSLCHYHCCRAAFGPEVCA